MSTYIEGKRFQLRSFIGRGFVLQQLNIATSGEIFMTMVLLCFLWISWCVMHSLFIDVSVITAVKKHASGLIRYYRLLYNGLSLVTFIPLIIVTRMAEGQMGFLTRRRRALPLKRRDAGKQCWFKPLMNPDLVERLRGTDEFYTSSGEGDEKSTWKTIA